eukprot:3214679-Alexandrium_andersonii.AAC.1
MRLGAAPGRWASAPARCGCARPVGHGGAQFKSRTPAGRRRGSSSLERLQAGRLCAGAVQHSNARAPSSFLRDSPSPLHTPVVH